MLQNQIDDTTIVDAGVRLSDDVFAWCVRNACKHADRGHVEHTIQWAIIAGAVADYFCSSKLANETLEATLRSLGSSMKEPLRLSPLREGNQLHWLHVLSRCYETGGHTALCQRWMELDPSDDVHSIALTFQGDFKIPEKFRQAVKSRGGDFHVLDATGSLMDRANAIKRLASQADVVVLHTHMWDPLPTVAFATPAGPPVCLVNHADHTYWTGASIADLILNIRPSGEALCLSHRGNGGPYRLPIPLPLPQVSKGDQVGDNLRTELGIPSSSPLYLTIGAAYKYVPTQEMNFLASVRNILEKVPSAYLVAVGPKPSDPLWEALATQTCGHAIAVGEKADIKPYLAAADIYLEGFPFGSLTALLEAVLAGIPPVLAPECCPLPYRSDDFALNSVPIPKDTTQYIRIAIELGIKTVDQSVDSSDLKSLAIACHCTPNWTIALKDLRNLITAGLKHNPSPLNPVAALSDHAVHYWARYSKQRRGADNVFGYAFRRAMKENLLPRVDLEMLQALRQAKAAGLQVAHPIKSYVGSLLMCQLPNDFAKGIYFRT